MGNCCGGRRGYVWEVTYPDGSKERVDRSSEAQAKVRQAGPGATFKAVSK